MSKQHPLVGAKIVITMPIREQDLEGIANDLGCTVDEINEERLQESFRKEFPDSQDATLVIVKPDTVTSYS